MGETAESLATPARQAAVIIHGAYEATQGICEEYTVLSSFIDTRIPQELSRMSLQPIASFDADPEVIIGDFQNIPWDRGENISTSEPKRDAAQTALERRAEALQHHRKLITQARIALTQIEGLPDPDYFGTAAALYALSPADNTSVSEADAARIVVGDLVASLQLGAPVMTRDVTDERDMPATGKIVGGRVAGVHRAPVNPNVPGAHIGMYIDLDQGTGASYRLTRVLPGLCDPANVNYLWVGPEQVRQFESVARSSGADPQALTAAMRAIERASSS